MRAATLWTVSRLAKLSVVMVYLIRKAIGNLRSSAIRLRPKEEHAMKLFRFTAN